MAPLHRRSALSSAGANTLIMHSSHPRHPLQQVHGAAEYLCGGCNALGSGTRYHCSACDFDLHVHCASCPSTLSSHFHPHHALTLQNKTVSDRFCDVCGDLVNGLFYSCEVCQFDVHPLCTLLPLNTKHVAHPHLLTLQPGNSSWCAVCRQVCNYWRYRCNACCLDLHLECALQPSDISATTQPPSPPYGGYAGTPCTGGNYYNMMPMNHQGFHMGMGQVWNQCQAGTSQPTHSQSQGQAGPGMVPNAYHASNNNNNNQGQAGGKGKSFKRKIFTVVGICAINAVSASLIGVPIAGLFD